MERNKYLRESRTERLRVHIIELLQEKTKLEEKKQRATKLIAELKTENQDLESTILLMEENAKSTNRFFTSKHNYYEKHFGLTSLNVLSLNKELEDQVKQLSQENRFLNSQLRDKEKEDFLLSEFLREKGLSEEASIYLLDNMEEEE